MTVATLRGAGEEGKKRHVNCVCKAGNVRRPHWWVKGMCRADRCRYEVAMIRLRNALSFTVQSGLQTRADSGESASAVGDCGGLLAYNHETVVKSLSCLQMTAPVSHLP